MAIRQRRRLCCGSFPVSDTAPRSTDRRSRVGPTRRLANAYSAVGGALLAAAKSALHPRAALAAALGDDSVEKEEEGAPRAELVDHGEAAFLGDNMALLPLLGSQLIEPHGEAPAFIDETATRFTEIEEQEIEGTTEPINSDLTGGIDRERKGGPISSAPRRLLSNKQGTTCSLADLIGAPPVPDLETKRTGVGARKPHQPFWKRGGMCADVVAGSPDARVARGSAKRSLPEQHIAADGCGASHTVGVQHHVVAALVSRAPHTGSSAAAVGAAGAAAVPNSPPVQILVGSPQAVAPPPQPPQQSQTPPMPTPQHSTPTPTPTPQQTPPPPTPPSSQGSRSSAASQGAEAAPGPNDRYFNWEASHLNLAIQIVSSIFPLLGFGEVIKTWVKAYMQAFIVFMMMVVGFTGLGMMSSTTAVGVNWIRNLAANFARATSTLAVVLLLLALSKPIGYGWGAGFGAVFGLGMITIWFMGDPAVSEKLGGWAAQIKTWFGSLKEKLGDGWDTLKQKMEDCFSSMKQN